MAFVALVAIATKLKEQFQSQVQHNNHPTPLTSLYGSPVLYPPHVLLVKAPLGFMALRIQVVEVTGLAPKRTSCVSR
jgi:hypothetical protein